jgi:hypothetical protein
MTQMHQHIQQNSKRRCIKKINWFYVAAAIACAAGATMVGVSTMGLGAPLIIGGLAFFMAGGALIFFGSV